MTITPAHIERLDREIAEATSLLDGGCQCNDCQKYCEEKRHELARLEAFKALIVAIEDNMYQVSEVSGNLYCTACGQFERHKHKPECQFNNAIALAKKALEV